MSEPIVGTRGPKLACNHSHSSETQIRHEIARAFLDDIPSKHHISYSDARR
jgi:hypothetical protein